MSCGYLFVDGKLIGEVSELSTEYDEIGLYDDPDTAVNLGEPIDVHFEMDRNSMLSLICGRPITNNWLKMHGCVMSRKHRTR